MSKLGTLQERMEERALSKVKQEQRELADLLARHPLGSFLKTKGASLDTCIRYATDVALDNLDLENALSKRFEYYLQREYNRFDNLMNNEKI